MNQKQKAIIGIGLLAYQTEGFMPTVLIEAIKLILKEDES